MRVGLSIAALVFLGSTVYAAAATPPTNCNAYNIIKGPYHFGQSATQQHNSGNHGYAQVTMGDCTYSGTAQVGIPVACAPYSTATSQSGASDYGSTAPYWHTAIYKDKSGSADGASGQTASSDAEGAAGVSSCLIAPCGLTITINGSGDGNGFSVGVSGTNVIWETSHHYANTCTAFTLPALPPATPVNCTIPQGDPPYPPQQGFMWIWNPAICGWQIVPSGESPVVIDTKGNWGKRALFSDPSKGHYVSFDMRGDGKLQKLSWPEPDSGLGWLALDTDGVIKNGKELFGNFTPHADADIPDYPNPNGFVALSWYDQPAQGGDMNLVLDERDEVWPKLKLWIDEHCYKEPDAPCQSRPEELHTLKSKGINSISLVWDASYKVDAVGNEYKFNAVLNPDEDREMNEKSRDGRFAYDVWLKQVE